MTHTQTGVGGVNLPAPHETGDHRNAGTAPQSADVIPAEAAAAPPTPPFVAEPDEPLCGITRSTGRIEWVCVRPVHDTGSKNRGQQISGYYPQSERHHFVPKYARGATS